MIEELGSRIAAHGTARQTETGIRGLVLHRAFSPTGEAAQSIRILDRPMVCVIAQGSKQVTVGNRIFRYDAASYLLTSVDLPVKGSILEASPRRPYLALSLELDPEALSAPQRKETPRGIAVTALTPELLEAFTRLLRLLDRPVEIPHLAPLIEREILYRLLTGPQGEILRQIALEGSRTQQVMRAIRCIRQNYAQPFRMSDVLRAAGMSAPSLHRHFKAVTAMSPLQYHKQIRLGEARRMLAAGGLSATAAAFSVGYQSPSQFSREYARLFGAPPRRDARRPMDSEPA